MDRVVDQAVFSGLFGFMGPKVGFGDSVGRFWGQKRRNDALVLADTPAVPFSQTYCCK